MSVTEYDASALATRLPKDQIADAVKALSDDDLPLYLHRLDGATSLINLAKKAVAAEMVLRKQIGLEWTSPEGTAYRFEQSGQTKWTQVGQLFVLLASLGIPVEDLGNTVSEARVLDLRAFAGEIADEAKRAEALVAIDNSRVWKPGSPALRMVDDPYRRKKVPARTK